MLPQVYIQEMFYKEKRTKLFLARYLGNGQGLT